MQQKTFIYLFSLLFYPLWFSLPAHAVLEIDITGGEEGALPIAIVPFAWHGTGKAPQDIASLITNDLARSGRFAPLSVRNMPQQPNTVETIAFPRWRSVGSQNLVIGSLSQKAGQYSLSFQLFDVLRAEQVVGYSFNAKAASLRSLAHRISDMIYQALTGEAGAFDSRIAYIVVTGNPKNKTYQLTVSDLDGYNPKILVRSQEPLLSPAWSPDGKRLAYVSLENKRTAVYVQNISTGQRDQVAAWPGLNSAPAWSPDGQHLALSLSKDGNPDIYILNLSTRHLQRVTNNRAIDTEPAWSPDGQTLIFTSDRAGSAQIYKTRINGGSAQRVTFKGSYNTRASFSADGEKLTFLHRNQQGYRIAILDLLTDDLTILSQSGMEESPSFAPNGSMVVYAAGQHLVVASADARVRQRLAIKAQGEVREPAWSPLNQ